VVPFCALSFAGLGLSSAAVAVAARLSTGWGGGPRTLMVEGANLSAYGSLWVVQFVLLDRVLFARPRPRPPGPRSGLEGPAPGGAPPPPGDPRPRRGRGGPPGPRAPSPRPTPAEAARRMPAMPLYDYRCRTCEAVFEDRRPMAEADRPATCPAGHTGAARLLPVFATAGRAAPPGPGACGAPVAGGCGGACACHPG
jgi:putative FmdB family regulatory protein